MCTRYISPTQGDIERFWNLRPSHAWRTVLTEIFPRAPGPFIRAVSGEPASELVVGQWGLVPHFAKSPKLTYSTFNARFEELSAKASYRMPWAQGQRCIIPAASFDEPCWETGRNVWWRFRRKDATPWGLAGLWNTWLDRETCEIVESYTMLTLNADAHPLMARMHKPDPELPPDRQDKRSVVPIDAANADQWLFGSQADAAELVRLTPAEVFDAGPVLPASPLFDGGEPEEK